MRFVVPFWLFAVLASIALGDDHWPQFRGPTGDGHCPLTAKIPLEWSETKNVCWKTTIHDRGWSSPVVWGNQIWCTTATEDGHRMYAVAVDLNHGTILHDIKLFDIDDPQPVHKINSYASPTPVIEAGRVYVHFGSYGTVCLDTLTGKTIWQRRDLKCDHYRGPGSSPILFGDLLILHFDGIDVQYLAALDKNTGKTVWKTDRSTDFGTLNGDLRKAYVTPAIVDYAGRQIMISPGAKAAMAYDPHTGRELWKVRYGGFSNASRPLAGQGLVFINTGFGKPELWAVRPDGQGDVTDSHVQWKVVKGVPAKPTPLLLGQRIFMANDTGIATWLDAKTGEVIWQTRLGGQYSASPIYASGRIYCFDQDGASAVIEPGDTYKLLVTNKLDDGYMASPAVVGDRLILRTKTRLVCVGQ